MPVIIPENLPAAEVLNRENIFVISPERAKKQDIRPLKVAIVNLMPTKIKTETQLLRMLSNTPLQVEIDLVRTASYESKNISNDHLEKFYTTFNAIKTNFYDAMIVTGAPVERMDFKEVEYWNELKEIFSFAEGQVYSTMFICWGAQAALNYYYNLAKYPLKEKITGIFQNRVLMNSVLTRGFDQYFDAPHSRYTYCKEHELQGIEDINILAKSKISGVHLAATKDHRKIFVFGHGEYDDDTLSKEYQRDCLNEPEPPFPQNYYVEDNPSKGIKVTWKAHGNLLFGNWLNYCVYQETPYKIEEIGGLTK